MSEVDRISNLPEILIYSILERLPIQDAVRTHILSKKWSYKWTFMRSLVLDKHFSEKFAKNGAFGRNGFILESQTKFLTFSRVLSPPLDFQGFLYLKDLCLENIEFGANLHGTIINLPQLKALELTSCTNVYNFKIRSTMLFQLKVIGCYDASLLQLLNSECLSRVVIAFCKPIQGVERVNLASLLSNMPCLQDLFVDGYFLQFGIAENIPKWLPHPINSLKSLYLLNFKFGDLFQLQAVLCMLRNSPNLGVLCVKNEDLPNMHLELDLKPALTYLEASDCLDQTLKRLKDIIFIHVEKSRPLLLFIKLLLAHSPGLENVSIRPNANANANEKHKFAKDVMRFPRASRKAQIVFMNLTGDLA